MEAASRKAPTCAIPLSHSWHRYFWAHSCPLTVPILTPVVLQPSGDPSLLEAVASLPSLHTNVEAARCPRTRPGTGAHPGTGRVPRVLLLSIPHPILAQQQYPALRRQAYRSSKLPGVTCGASGNIKDRCDQRSLVPIHGGPFLYRISSFAHLYEGLHSVLSQGPLQVSAL